jgi:hypothetical protein
MTQAEAKDAVNGACVDGLKKVFGGLVLNLIDQQPQGQATREFKTACEFHLRAYAIAIAVVEEVFKD